MVVGLWLKAIEKLRVVHSHFVADQSHDRSMTMTPGHRSSTAAATVTARLVGGPTALFEIDGVRLLTDPTFDPPGDHPIGKRNLIKTSEPAVSAGDIGNVDVVLLSHDQHPDNLDDEGRAFIKTVPLILTTASAAQRLEGSRRAADMAHPQPGAAGRKGHSGLPALPAQHGPAGTEHITGEVRGFVLSGDDLPTIYISGDNASLSQVARSPTMPARSTWRSCSRGAPAAP